METIPVDCWHSLRQSSRPCYSLVDVFMAKVMLWLETHTMILVLTGSKNHGCGGDGKNPSRFPQIFLNVCHQVFFKTESNFSEVSAMSSWKASTVKLK